MQLWECDPHSAARANGEARLRAGGDAVAEWIVLVEAATPAAATRCMDALAGRLGAESPQVALMRAPVYRLAWRMQAGEAPAPCADRAGVADLPA